MTKGTFQVTGMTCAACQANVTRRVSKIDGVSEVDVNLLSGRMQLLYEPDKTNPVAIAAAVKEIGYGASFAQDTDNNAPDFTRSWQERREREAADQAALRRRLLWSTIILIPLMYLSMGPMLSLPLPPFFAGAENMLVYALTQLILTLPVMLINNKFFRQGIKALWKRSPNMDSLIALGSTAALLYSIYAIYQMAWAAGRGMLDAHMAHSLYFEACAMILTLVTAGKYLEARSKSKTTAALDKMMDLAPATATVIREKGEEVIPAREIVVGDVILIRPGDSIPADGTVISGSGYVDQAAITGESIPVEVGVGSEVICATVNQNGTFRFTASKVGADTTLAQMIRLVDEAGSSKAPVARLADKISGVFVPVVIGIALITAVVWLLAGAEFSFALSCAIGVLVVSCPCALGLATPVAIMAGTGRAAEMGILIKSAKGLETLHSVDTIVLDKTGTVTSGHPAVTDAVVLDSTLSRKDFLRLAAAAEAGSEHPLAEAVLDYVRGENIEIPQGESFEAIPGRGVRITLSGKTVLAGNAAFLSEEGLQQSDPSGMEKSRTLLDQLSSQGKTPILFASDKKIAGIIAAADTVRPTSKAAIETFHKMGLHVVMLTGDNEQVAKAVAAQMGIEEVIAGVLPTGKEASIRALQEQGRTVAMAGDGINDAPALVRADVGIAVGAGTDIAMDSADVVLMKDTLLDAARAISLSRAVLRNIRMNLFWAFFYNVLGIPVAAGVLYPALGLLLSPMLCAAAMSVSSLCVVTNALRLRFFKDKIVSNNETSKPGGDLPPETKGDNKMEKVLTVEGMMCGHCKAHVEKALADLTGVTSAQVNLEKKTATVALSENVPDDVLKNAVEQAGYTVTAIAGK